MKILFILPDVDSFHKLNIHFGIAYISGVLKSNGYNNIRFLTVKSNDDYERVISEAVSFKPDIVAFSSVETQFGNVMRLSQKIKDALNCIIVCGGVFTTISPECVKDAESLDGIFLGESEMAFLKFVRTVENGKDFRETENFCYYNKDEDRVVKNSLMPLENDLDRLGFPDRDIFNFQEVINYYDGAAPFMFNRGCPYKCAFCSNHVLASFYHKKSNTTRRRSVDSCIKEIIEVNKKYTFDIIHIWDDLFTSKRSWLYEFLEKYKSEINKPFMCTARSNLCDDELFRKLKKGGCYKVHMSLESGNDFIRNKIMARNISKELIKKSFNQASRNGIKVSASSIIGLPFETENMIQETIDILAALNVESPGVNIFYPYTGTALRKVCEDYGMISSDRKYDSRERRETVLQLPHISKARLQYYHDNFEALVRKKEGIVPYLKLQSKVTAKKILPPYLLNIIKSIMKPGVSS
jgi:radical SAM superfamily enzyme YgiQ (UPF0313 family)